MAKRKSNPEIKKNITPIGKEVPKEGISIDPKLIQNAKLGKRTYKLEGVHKDDGLGGKIGPKQVSQKMQPKIEINPKKPSGR